MLAVTIIIKMTCFDKIDNTPYKSVTQPNLLLHRLMQHFTSCDKMEHGYWKPDGLDDKQQQRVHCVAVVFCPIAMTFNQINTFCHVTCDVSSICAVT